MSVAGSGLLGCCFETGFGYFSALNLYSSTTKCLLWEFRALCLASFTTKSYTVLPLTTLPPPASATRPGAARVFLHCPALSLLTDGMPFSSICARFASVCCAFFCAACNSQFSLRPVRSFEKNTSACCLLRQVQRWTAAACSTERGRWRSLNAQSCSMQVERSHKACHLYARAVCPLHCYRVAREAYSKLTPLCSRH